ncbi:hypothetical protein DFJ74DRAFT_712836 [Hyaloraphidium curvatum]|nr:hypothetical protein DFJ74DRAFT_712836 [Hyaloraphidium curvatum]
MSPEETDPKWPPAFTPTVWAALFPAYPSPPPPADMPPELARLASPAVAAQARAERPMTLKQLLAGLPIAPLERGLVRVQLAVLGKAGGNATFFLHRALYVACRVALMPALVWIGNSSYGLFGTRQLVAMTVGYAVQQGMWELGIMRGRVYGKEEEVFLGIPEAQSALDNHLMAGVARYRLLQEDASDVEATPGELAAVLLEHEPGDTLCSCPKSRCAGRQLDAVPALGLATFAAIQCGQFVVFLIVSFWTVLVTFRGFTWSSPWAATLVAVAVGYVALHLVFVTLGVSMGMSNFAIFGLEGRLANAEEEGLPSEAESEPYVVLHAALATSWSSRLSLSESNRFVSLMGFLGDFLAIVIVMISSSCITAPFLASFLWMGSIILVFDLINLAAANSETSRIAALYSSAILRGFTDVDAYRARFFEVPVTPALVRTAAVTAFTVGVGMWSVLRGAGIGVTIEMACPSAA